MTTDNLFNKQPKKKSQFQTRLSNLFVRIIQRQKLRARYRNYGKYKEVPKDATEIQRTCIEIFKYVLHNKNVELDFDKKSGEVILYLEDTLSDSHFYIVLEDGNIQIVNTVHGYDERITSDIHEHLMWLFENTQNIEFLRKKNAIRKKVSYSMGIILEKVKQSKEDNNK